MVEFLNNKNSGFNNFVKNRAQNKDQGARPSFGNRMLIWTVLLMGIWMFFFQEKSTPVRTLPIEIDRELDLSGVTILDFMSQSISYTVQGLRISNIILNDYRLNKNSPGLPSETMFDREHKVEHNVRLLGGDREFIEVGLFGNGTSAPTAQTEWQDMQDTTDVTWKGDNAEFRRSVKSGNYVIIITDAVKNTSAASIQIMPYTRIVRHGSVERRRFGIRTGAISLIKNRIKTETWNRLTKKSPIFQTDNSAFTGFSDQYWQTITRVKTETPQTIRIRQRMDELFQTETTGEWVAIEPGQTHTFETAVFAGPKTQTALAKANEQIPGIDRTIDYGWFGFLSRPMLWTLEKIHGFIPNWGLAIILLTLIIRGFMWPLTRKSFVAMQAMQKIQPELQRIQKLYANDKMRMQQEIMRMYRSKKANPFAGIGLMILQVPIFFALYKALVVAVPLRHAEFLWIRDLSAMDALFIMPILMGLTMWVQGKFTHAKNSTAPGANMMKYLPFIFAGVFAWMPSGLVLYWTTSNIAGIFQLWLMRKEKTNGKNK